MERDRESKTESGPDGFAHRFTLALAALNLSRGAAAQALGVDKSVISRWASGAAVPSGHNLSRLTALVQRTWPHFTQPDWHLPVAAFTEAMSARPRPLPQSAGPPPPDRPSIAVLPFTNMSGEAEQEYFADGIVEDIITALSKWRWFFVIARNSTFAYKGRSVDVVRIGSELGVRHVLEGSVRKFGSRVRVTAQLIDAVTGTHVWADRYDRELRDIFAVQDEVTRSVVGAIEPALLRSEATRAVRKTGEQLQARDHLMRGIWNFEHYTRAGNEEALRCFMQALELDPGLADAHAWIGRVHLIRTSYRFTDDREASWTAAAQAARRALAIDRESAIAQFVLAMAASWAGETDAALGHAKLALEINPNLALAYGAQGIANCVAGRFTEALASLDSALRLSPNDSQAYVWHAFRGTTYYLQGDYQAALEWTRRSAGIRWFFRACLAQAAALAQLGAIGQAQAVVRDILAQDAGEKTIAVAVSTFFRAEDRAHLAEGLRKAGLPEGR